MAKPSIIYSCSHCDAQYAKWTGRCLTCGKWGTIPEEPEQAQTTPAPGSVAPATKAASVTGLTQQTTNSAARSSTQIQELDRVLGGGLVTGSYLLLGGEPGIGKSTISLQLAAHMKKTLYASAEESVSQIQMRAKRLGVTSNTISLIQESNIDTILATAKKEQPELLIIDSVQTVYTAEADSGPGTVGQVRACATKMMTFAKQQGITTLVIGHVTKDGNVAGPKTLEHLVDTVLYLEGDRFHTFRMLRWVLKIHLRFF
jgi:DNA repair protein RadA/Sms